MFKLTDLYSRIIKKPLPTDCGITCEILDGYMATLNRLLTESVSCYSYTLILSGTQTITYNDRSLTLVANDLFISTPGMKVFTENVSDDYSAICLMGDEAVTYEIPYARNIITASYFPAMGNSESKLSLTQCEAQWLRSRMDEIMTYIKSDHIFKNKCLSSLYSLFILDLLNVESRFNRSEEFNCHVADLFLKFLKLISENFINHHDIAFYADSLAVTTIYLSRVVKRVSGQTVKNHIDRLLVMEAAYQLSVTDKSIAEIAETLNFSGPASFCKFFARHKGIPPRVYRFSDRL